jgi:hypothetical protein
MTPILATVNIPAATWLASSCKQRHLVVNHRRLAANTANRRETLTPEPGKATQAKHYAGVRHKKGQRGGG